MLRLPANLLVMDQASVDAYAKRAAAGGDAEFDFRGINWFGRDRDISTAVSPRSFAAAARRAAVERAPRNISALATIRRPSELATALVPAVGRPRLRPCRCRPGRADLGHRSCSTAGDILAGSIPMACSS